MHDFNASAEDLHGSLAHMGGHLIVRHELPIHIPVGLFAQRLHFHCCRLNDLHVGQMLHIDTCTMQSVRTFNACKITSQRPAVKSIAAAHGPLEVYLGACTLTAVTLMLFKQNRRSRSDVRTKCAPTWAVSLLAKDAQSPLGQQPLC